MPLVRHCHAVSNKSTMQLSTIVLIALLGFASARTFRRRQTQNSYGDELGVNANPQGAQHDCPAPEFSPEPVYQAPVGVSSVTSSGYRVRRSQNTYGDEAAAPVAEAMPTAPASDAGEQYSQPAEQPAPVETPVASSGYKH